MSLGMAEALAERAKPKVRSPLRDFILQLRVGACGDGCWKTGRSMLCLLDAAVPGDGGSNGNFRGGPGQNASVGPGRHRDQTVTYILVVGRSGDGQGSRGHLTCQSMVMSLPFMIEQSASRVPQGGTRVGSLSAPLRAVPIATWWNVCAFPGGSIYAPVHAGGDCRAVSPA